MARQLSIAFQTDKSPAQYIALAKQVNLYDFDVISVYCDAPYHPSYGPLLLMAPYVDRARLGPAAVSPSRIVPIDMAAETALLSQVAASGVYLGIARGAWLETHGISEARPPLKAIRECVEIVRRLLSDEDGGYAGEVYQLAPHVRAPYPLPDGAVPILIGTWGPKLAALAGELADEVKVGGSTNPDVVPIMQKYVAEGERHTDRPVGEVGVVMGAVTVVDADREQARLAARRAVALYLPVVGNLDPTVEIEPELIERLQLHADRHEYDVAGRLISDDLLDRFAFAGNPSDIIQQVEALFAAGASRIEFGTPHGLTAQNGIEILGRQVLPSLKN